MTDRWIPVSERLPGIGKNVLVYFGGAEPVAYRYGLGAVGITGMWFTLELMPGPVTHWRELPPAPELEGGC